MLDDWKGEHLIRTKTRIDEVEAAAAVRAQHALIRRAASIGLSEADTVRTTGLSLYRVRAIKDTLGVTFRDGRRTRAIEGRV